MISNKGNIMNRKPKQVRDKNHTFQQQQETQFETQQSYKEQKLQQITQHRKMAILGGKQEKLQLQQAYQKEAQQLIQYQQTKKQQAKMEEQAIERRIHQKYIEDCNRAVAEQNQKRLNAMQVAQDNMNMAANRQRQ